MASSFQNKQRWILRDYAEDFAELGDDPEPSVKAEQLKSKLAPQWIRERIKYSWPVEVEMWAAQRHSQISVTIRAEDLRRFARAGKRKAAARRMVAAVFRRTTHELLRVFGASLESMLGVGIRAGGVGANSCRRHPEAAWRRHPAVVHRSGGVAIGDERSCGSVVMMGQRVAPRVYRGRREGPEHGQLVRQLHG